MRSSEETKIPERRGNDGRMESAETKNRFPSLPTVLGNRLRDSHISTAPTVPLFLSKPTLKGVLRAQSASPQFRLTLQ